MALFQTRQTNSHARMHLHLVSPSPPPPHPSPHLQCWTRVHVISTEFQHCMGGIKQRNLQRITVLFENSVLKTQKINAITQVSQGILSTIVAGDASVDSWFRKIYVLRAWVVHLATGFAFRKKTVFVLGRSESEFAFTLLPCHFTMKER